MSGPSETTSRTQAIHRLMKLVPKFDTTALLVPSVPEAAFIPHNLEALDVRTQP